jgi:CheY-like chemotaxis protein
MLKMLNTMRFLYVEDDPFSREVLRMILTVAAGVPQNNLAMFEDSTDFMARLKALSIKPDVILLDIHMKPDDGFSLLRQLRADPEFSAARVVALTASVMNEEIKQLRHSGFNGAISKPLGVATFPDLLARIARGEPVWYIG